MIKKYNDGLMPVRKNWKWWIPVYGVLHYIFRFRNVAVTDRWFLYQVISLFVAEIVLVGFVTGWVVTWLN